MRTRYKSPTGSGILTLPDDATVADVFAAIRTQTEIAAFSLKYGWPLKELDRSLATDIPAREVGLHGETLTVVPDETTAPPSSSSSIDTSISAPLQHQQRQPPSAKTPEDVTVPWPEREGTLLLRVMPSDNSCLFTAFGGALPRQLPAPELRTMIADFIRAHPDEYNEAILGMAPEKYRRVIQTPDYWGGAIELSIFSSLFDVEICTYDVKTTNLLRFGENKTSRCILVYSGIHYDRVAFSPSDPPFTIATLPPELDRTIWETTDDAVLQNSGLLVQQLNQVHYYTDPADLVLHCEHPGCNWLGSGEAAGQRHANETGHTSLAEIDDSAQVLLSCKVPGCDWLGGLAEAKKHGIDTGHTSLGTVPVY